MMSEMRFWYPASITQITSINDSFDSCILSVCYAGRNRNQSNISKDAIERAIPTMSYCPIVANYDVESDSIGGHDVEFVESDGMMKMVNLTDAVGVIPENPQWCWKTKTDDDGVEREYLCTPAILWKRTPVYDKLKRDGTTGQSMEISVKDGRIVDGLYDIYDFEFTAFCLLGEDVEPCFEGASAEMFSIGDLSKRMSEMMEDFKENFTKVIAASADDNTTPNGENNTTEGRGCSLNIEELLQKYGLSLEDIDFETADMSEEQVEQRIAEIKTAKFEDGNDDGDDAASDGASGEEDDATADDNGEDGNMQYGLTGEQMHNGILDALYTITYVDEWGSWPRYCYTDYDPVACEVYAYDNEDWNLYGFTYSMNGDNVVIDFDSKKRKKIAFVDFENGDMQFSYEHLLDSANARFNAVVCEVNALREYKRGVESEARKSQENEVFERFADIADDERFIRLKDNCADMSIEDIEDKCYAIRGRNAQVKFSQNPTSVRLPVDDDHGDGIDADEPYNGVFVKYGICNK